MSATRRKPVSRHLPLLAGAILLLALAWLRPEAPAPAPAGGAAQAPVATAAITPATAAQLPAFLPAEAGEVVERILRGGPYERRQDGSVFFNRERLLPARERGYYREYTVPTPGLSHRGARRIVTGGHPPVEWYYTADHYASFRAFQVTPVEARR